MSIKADILKAIQENRNQGVLKELYVNVLPKVKNYILKNSGNKQDAQDVFQDAVISFMHSVKTGRFDATKDIDAYIYVIAKNIWINKIKRNQKTLLNNEISEKTDDLMINQLDLLITKEREEAFQKVFAQLSDNCMDLMKLSIYDDLPPRKIMEKLKFSSIDVTRTNLYRCRKKLTDLILLNKRDLATS